MTPRPRVLVVEDDDDTREVLLELLESWGFQGVAARTCKEAVRCLGELPFAGMVLDNILPDGTGLELLEFVRHERDAWNIPVVFVTGRPIDAARHQVAAALRKPVKIDELERAVRSSFRV